jgi:hypothetical protein
MTIMSRIFGTAIQTLTDEEARTVINALRRSREAMPDMTETIASREIRAKREQRIERRISAQLVGEGIN